VGCVPADAHAPGVHLERTAECVDEITALAAVFGGAVGVDGVLNDLNRQARRARGWFGRAVSTAYTWDRADRRTWRWWPQGITTSADASDTEDIGGRRVLVVSWYSKEIHGENQGSRLTFLDLDTLRYRHVLLVVPTIVEGGVTLEPLKVHAGGIVWWGPYLHIAATARGFMTCRVDDLMRVPEELSAENLKAHGVSGAAAAAYGHRYVLPVRFTHRAYADDGQAKLRYSFLSLDRTPPATLVAGEYGNASQTTRLARFPLDASSSLLETGEDGKARPVELEPRGVTQMQGATIAKGRWYVSVSHGPLALGSIFVGAPGDLRRRRFATPMGPEDITYWPSTDTLWSVSEHPHCRWIYAMKRAWFD
jgi:hypothetical protein